MPATPAVSLILATYARTSELGRLFQSLAEQRFKDFEVVVVDQNPDERISTYLEKAGKSGICIRHIKHALPNLSAARNIGIQAARGEWVGFPDDDCWYEPDLLEQLSPCFACRDALSGAAARWAELYEAGQLPSSLSWKRSRQFRDRVVASFMLFCNRKLFEQVGNFDPRLGVGQWFGAAEETDLIMRALAAGASLCIHSSAIVHHPFKLYGATSGERAEVRQRARGTGALYAKHKLPRWVIARGLLAPVVRSFLVGGAEDRIQGWMDSIGRLEGMLHWKYRMPFAVDILAHKMPAAAMEEVSE